MKRPTVRNSTLALVGLASLVIYILACTSFSPDDRRVLYPTFDSASGGVGVASYDRDSKRSELLFVPHLRAGEEPGGEPPLLRPQWLPDGRSVLVAWPGAEGTADSGDSLSLAVVPVGARGPVRLFHLADLPEAAARLSLPLCVSGNRLFLQGESNTVVRLDLVTGEVKRQTCAKEVIPYASPLPDRPCYAIEKNADGRFEVGFLDPETFALTPIVRLDADESLGDGGLLALSRDGHTAAFVAENGKQPVILFKESRKPAQKSPKLAADDEKLSLVSAQFSPRGDVLYASFMQAHGEATNSALGFLEVPADGKPARRVTLIQRGPEAKEEAAFYFQIGVSHDGKTLAVASTYLAFAEGTFRSDDCALFLVDLSDPQRKVTKVPIPLPPKPKSD
jgi:hypothetical protein